MEDQHTRTPQAYYRGYAAQEGRVFQMRDGLQINTENLNIADYLDPLSLQGLSSYSPTPISSSNPLTLGVHRSEANQSGSLPEYITRSIDTELRARVADVASCGGFVLLVGDSTAGKSRSAFEALNSVVPDSKIWAPIDGSDLVRNLKTIIEAQDDCFIWLDDLERYIGPDGLNPTVLTIITQFKMRVIATMRAEQYRRLSPEERQNERLSDDHRHTALGSRVLEQLDTLVLPRLWSDAEISRARQAVDSRITSAVAHSKLFGVSEYLAAGPRLFREWTISGGPGGNPRGAALVAAAVDFARCGVTDPVPLPLLMESHEVYLQRAGGDLLRPESREEALEWASRRRYGVTSLLMPVKSGSEYRVFDYLPDALARSEDAPSIPAESWSAALQFTGSVGLSFHVGMAAVQHNEWDVAKKAWQADLQTHPIPARINLGRVYMKLRDVEKAKELWQEATNLGSIDASIYLGSEYEKEGRINKAIELYKMGAEKDDAHAIRHLAYVLPNEKEAIKWWLKIAESDDSGHAAYNLSFSYQNIGDHAASKTWLKLAAERGVDRAINNYALTLLEEGEKEQGLHWLRKGVELKNPKSMINWAERFASDDEQEAVRLLNQAIELGEPAGYNALGILRADAGDSAGAGMFWRKGHEAGDVTSSVNLARQLKKSGSLEEATGIYRTASAEGDRRAALDLAFILAESGDPEEAEIQFRYALDIASEEDICDFGRELARRKIYEQAMKWLDLALLREHTHAGCVAGQVCFNWGRYEDGMRLLYISLSGGHKHAGEVLSTFLVRTGNGAAAAQIMRATTTGRLSGSRRGNATRRRRKRRKR